MYFAKLTKGEKKMKIFRIIGIVLVIAAIFGALGIVGRMDTEETQFLAGDLLLEEMTPTSEVLIWIGISSGVAAIGIACFVIQFLADTHHLSFKFQAEDTDVLSIGGTLSTPCRTYTYLTEDDYVGDIEIKGVPLSLYRTEDDVYVITDPDDYNTQFWSGDIHALKALEAEYDNE